MRFKGLLPVQIGSNQRWAEVGGWLCQSEGKDGVLQLSDAVGVTFGSQRVEHMKQHGDMRVIHHHFLLFHLLQDVHRLCRQEGIKDGKALSTHVIAGWEMGTEAKKIRRTQTLADGGEGCATTINGPFS